MTHFTERKHLIHWIMQNCTRKSVVRAMDEGTVEHLGAFINLGPNDGSGWVIRVTSETGKQWIVEVAGHAHARRFGIFIRDVARPEGIVLWENWVGGECGTMNILYHGDNRVEYMRLRDERRKELAKDITKED